MTPSDLGFGNSDVIFWDLEELRDDRPLAEQVEWLLKEDLAQVELGNDLVVGIGWYPEFSREGSFGVHLVHKDDWIDPVLHLSCNTIAELKECVAKAVAVAKEVAAAKRSPLS